MSSSCHRTCTDLASVCSLGCEWLKSLIVRSVIVKEASAALAQGNPTQRSTAEAVEPWDEAQNSHTIFALHVLKKGVTKQVQFQSYRNRTSHFFQSYLRLRKWEFLCMLSHSSNAHDRIVPRSETRSWELHPSLPEVSGSQLFRQSLLPPGSVM